VVRLMQTDSEHELVKLLVDNSKPTLRAELMHFELRSASCAVVKVRQHEQFNSDPRNSSFKSQFIARRNISEIQSREELESDSQIDDSQQDRLLEL